MRCWFDANVRDKLDVQSVFYYILIKARGEKAVFYVEPEH